VYAATDCCANTPEYVSIVAARGDIVDACLISCTSVARRYRHAYVRARRAMPAVRLGDGRQPRPPMNQQRLPRARQSSLRPVVSRRPACEVIRAPATEVCFFCRGRFALRSGSLWLRGSPSESPAARDKFIEPSSVPRVALGAARQYCSRRAMDGVVLEVAEWSG